MELSILLMEQIAKLFLMIFMGYAVVKLGLLTDEHSYSVEQDFLRILNNNLKAFAGVTDGDDAFWDEKSLDFLKTFAGANRFLVFSA